MIGWKNNKLIKATLGITEQLLVRDLIELIVCHLYVELRLPVGAAPYKGRSVRPLKSYMIWVHSVARQEGFYLQLKKIHL